MSADPPLVHVRRRLRRTDDGRIEIDTPKTRASARVVVLPGPLGEALARHLEQFVGPAASAPVFTTVRGTIPARSNLASMLRRAMCRAGVEQVRFHDLRHVAQVLAAENGAILAELMARMGHASTAAAQVYMHARPARDAVLARRLSAEMARVSDSTTVGTVMPGRPADSRNHAWPALAMPLDTADSDEGIQVVS